MTEHVGDYVPRADRDHAETVLTDGRKQCLLTSMTHTNFADATNYSIEQVWGGPCDHHNCQGAACAFITINFADGGSVGGYFCRTHLNAYEVAYGLPQTDCKHAFSNTTSECHFCGAKAWAA